MIRVVSAFLFILAGAGGLFVAGYACGAMRWKRIGRSSATVVEAARAWRELDERGEDEAAALQLQTVRETLEAQDDQLRLIYRRRLERA